MHLQNTSNDAETDNKIHWNNEQGMIICNEQST